MKSLYYKIIYGLQNLFTWFRVIWKDRDWDHYWIYYILRFKLSRMVKSFEKYDIHVGNERHIKQMKTCVWLLDRLIGNDYADKEWEEAIQTDETGLYNWGRSLTEIELKSLNVAQYKEYYMRTQDKEMLFDILKKYIEEWWH